MKRKVKWILFGIAAGWLVFGLAIRYRVVHILKLIENGVQDYSSPPVFGIKLYSSSDTEPIVWLDEKQSESLWMSMLRGERDHSPYYPQRYLTIHGYIYIYPNWMKSSILRYLFLPTQALTMFQYVPVKRRFYISEDCEELSFEYNEGLGTDDIAPEVIGLDLYGFVREKILRGSPPERWQDGLEDVVEEIMMELDNETHEEECVGIEE